jgi:hypothetical protein
MCVAVDKAFVGLLAVPDPITPTTPEAIRTPHKLGLRVIMITGDGVNPLPVTRDHQITGMLSREDVISFLSTIQELGM